MGKKGSTTYKVVISLEVISKLSEDDLAERISNLLEYGTVRDCFDAADMDASYFHVDQVERKP